MHILSAVLGGFVTGIFLRSVVFESWWPILYIVLLAALVGAFVFIKPRRSYSLGVLFLLFVALGMLRSSLADTKLSQSFVADLRHRVAYDGVVVGDPDIREKSQRIAVRVQKGSESVGALAVMPLSAHVAVGDHMRVTGTLQVPQAFETDNGRTFRYDQYLAARGIYFLIEFGSIRVTQPAPWYSLPASLARVKHAFLDGLDRALPDPASALAGGVVIGGKAGLPKSLQDAFIRSGLVQIIVLSGYNVMIVAEWVMLLLASVRLPRGLQFFAGGAALLLFIGIAGVSTTAVRAAVMAIIALYARATGKSYAASRALLFTVFCMLLWNPLLLCFDPGFGLSVAATAGIIWLAPIIETRIRERRALRFGRVSQVQQPEAQKASFWVNAIATTIAAQVAVLPLLLYDTGNLSLVALPANLVVNPLVPLAMAAAAIAGVSGMLLGAFPALLHLLGLPALALTNTIIFIAEKSAALPYAALSLPAFPFWLVLLAYAALIAASKRFSTTVQLRLAKNASI